MSLSVFTLKTAKFLTKRKGENSVSTRVPSCWWCYSTTSEGWGCGVTQQKPKMARRRGSDAGQSRKEES